MDRRGGAGVAHPVARHDAPAAARLPRRDPYDRSPFDVLWHRDTTHRAGRPMFAHVHTGRHRAAMLRPRCQVCGVALPDTDIPWLLPRPEYERITSTGPDTTGTPPTCPSCWDTAQRLCPHLRRGGAVRCLVAARGLWGVAADLYHPDRDAWTTLRCAATRPPG